jgi:hypothetical protein
MYLWLTCTLEDGLCRMPVEQSAIDSDLVDPMFRRGAMAVAADVSFAYLTWRRAGLASDGGQVMEAGVDGHGSAPRSLTGSRTKSRPGASASGSVMSGSRFRDRHQYLRPRGEPVLRQTASQPGRRYVVLTRSAVGPGTWLQVIVASYHQTVLARLDQIAVQTRVNGLLIQMSGAPSSGKAHSPRTSSRESGCPTVESPNGWAQRDRVV